MDSAGAQPAVFRPVPGHIQFFTADGAPFGMLGDILTIEQRLQLWVCRQYGAPIVFTERRTSISRPIKHIALAIKHKASVLAVEVRAHIGGEPPYAAQFLTGKLPEIHLHTAYINPFP